MRCITDGRSAKSPERRRRHGAATGKTDRFSRSGFGLQIAESNSVIRKAAWHYRCDRRATSGRACDDTRPIGTPEGGKMSAQSIDYDGLMQANLTRVFGERDATRRLKAIVELYADDAVLYEPPDAAASGHAAINQT